MTPAQAFDARHGAGAWDAAAAGVRSMWLSAWTIAHATARQDALAQARQACEEWATVCRTSRRHGCMVGAQECAKLIGGLIDGVRAD